MEINAGGRDFWTKGLSYGIINRSMADVSINLVVLEMFKRYVYFKLFQIKGWDVQNSI